MLLRCDVFFFKAEDGIRDLVRSRGLGDVYKRQAESCGLTPAEITALNMRFDTCSIDRIEVRVSSSVCLLYTSDAADERSSVDLGGRRIIKKKKKQKNSKPARAQRSINEKHQNRES